MVSKAFYASRVLPELTEFKFRHFGHDQVILHEREIRKDHGDFAFLKEPGRKDAFLEELTELIASFEMTVVASVIRKTSLVSQYASPKNPYEIALAFGLERVYKYLNRRGAASTKTTVLVECRGKREDDELELEFRRICAGANYWNLPLNFEPRFVPKAGNVLGLQIADLLARPIGRHVLNPAQPNRAFDVLEGKLDRSPQGEVLGWGLKVFPS